MSISSIRKKATPWEVCEDAVLFLIEWYQDQGKAIRRIGLCFGRHMFSENPYILSETQPAIVDKLIRVAESKRRENRKNQRT